MDKIKRFQRISQEKGITLVALVITIIILIILATVAISFAFGNNGLINRAEDARDYYANDTSYTDESIINVESYLDEIINEVESGNGGGNSDIPIEPEKSEVEEAKESGTVFDDTTTITDKPGNKITIPEGFKIANDSGDTVEQGIVIEDVNASTDTAVQGSQYVWIPVGSFINDDGETKEVILGRYTFAKDSNGTPNLVQAAFLDDGTPNYTEQSDNILIDSYYKELVDYREGETGFTDAENATAYNLAGFLESARDNGGYYIGRYEASYASGTNNINDIEDYSQCKAASIISTAYYNSNSDMKYQEGTLWHFITQLEASKVAINTYSDSDAVISDLMNSYAWDTAIVYIQQSGHNNYANQTSKNSSLANTGANGDEVCKINDMASNLNEWTTEYCSYSTDSWNYPNVNRGGERSRATCVATRENNPFTIFSSGFRIILYV